MAQHVFITGGASGIGKQLTLKYLQQGHSVSLFDVQPADDAIQALIQQTGCSANAVSGYQVDITDAKAVEAVFAQAAQANQPDIVIHCAGICQAVPLTEHSSEHFNLIINVNLIGSRNVAAAGIQQLPDNGHLVLFGSMASFLGCYGYTAYSASKFGVRGLAEVLRIELQPRGIDVSLVCPPEVETPMVENERLHRPKITEAMKMVAGHLNLEEATDDIFQGIAKRKFIIVVGSKAKTLSLVIKYVPDFINRFVTDKIFQRLRKLS